MSALDPTIVQQLPTGADDATDVGLAVVEYLTHRNLPEVGQDHEARIRFGEKKYGQRLKTHNGRDAIMDSYQELLDFLSYAMQAHLEGKPGFLYLFDQVAILSAAIRRVMDGAILSNTGRPKPRLKFITNTSGESVSEKILRHASRYSQDPESVVAIPFSELEQTGMLGQVDSNFSVEGQPVPFDVFGEATATAIEAEAPSELGEDLLRELEAIEEAYNSPSSSEVANPTTAFIVGEDGFPVSLIESEEALVRLESRAKGEHNGF